MHVISLVCQLDNGDPNGADFAAGKEKAQVTTRLCGYKFFFMLNLAEHEIYPAGKIVSILIFISQIKF